MLLKRKIGLALIVVIAAFFRSTPVFSSSASSIADGMYTVRVYGWHETKDEPSIMAPMLNPIAQIEINSSLTSR
jgi:hypothetical protein